MKIALVSLGAGLVVGWLGQRSRFCSIGGLRDFLLTGDKSLLMGLLGLFLAAWVLYPLVNTRKLLQPPELVEQINDKAYTAQEPVNEYLARNEGNKFEVPTLEILIFISAFGVGFISLLNDGCPFRQHVLAGEGLKTAIYYLAGFYLAALVFDLWSVYFLRWLF